MSISTKPDAGAIPDAPSARQLRRALCGGPGREVPVTQNLVSSPRAHKPMPSALLGATYVRRRRREVRPPAISEVRPTAPPPPGSARDRPAGDRVPLSGLRSAAAASISAGSTLSQRSWASCMTHATRRGRARGITPSPSAALHRPNEGAAYHPRTRDQAMGRRPLCGHPASSRDRHATRRSPCCARRRVSPRPATATRTPRTPRPC